MYTLLVFYEGDTTPSEVYTAANAHEVVTRIPEILAAHDGCEHIVVKVGSVRLFSVDCHGNRQP